MRRSALPVVLAWFACAAGCEEPLIIQPLPFNHQIHAKNDVTCDTCHEHAYDGQHATLPRVETCMGCHEMDITENPGATPVIALLRKHAEEGKEIEWVRLYELPQHVYYSHRRHTTIAKLECPTCHGGIGESRTPPPRPVATTLDMNTCMDCHEQRGVDNDCAWCHR